MKSGSASAMAFGSVLKAVRTQKKMLQAEVAASFTPALSIPAVSMAEAGSRPPKSETMVRCFANALSLDDDRLVELWWATQGLVAVENETAEPQRWRWWRDLWPSPQVEVDHNSAVHAATAKWTPNENWQPPALELFCLAEAIRDVLGQLLGSGWEIGQEVVLGLHEPFDGHSAEVRIMLRWAGGSSEAPPELVGSFACPEPASRVRPAAPARQPEDQNLPPEVGWIVSAVMTMPQRERLAVAAFIRGLREGMDLFATDPHT